MRKLMEQRGTTQNELADYLNKTRQAVSYYCDGSSSPDWETLVKIADFFDVSVDYLLGRTGDQKRAPSSIDELGLTEEAVMWLSAINDHKRWGIGLNVNTIFENPFFRSLVSGIDNYMDAARAEMLYVEIYDRLIEEPVDSPQNAYKEVRQRIEKAISDTIENGQNSDRINEHLRANLLLWRLDDDGMTDIIMPVSGITDVTGYAVSKSLTNLLDSLRKEVKKEVSRDSAIKKKG